MGVAIERDRRIARRMGGVVRIEREADEREVRLGSERIERRLRDRTALAPARPERDHGAIVGAEDLEEIGLRCGGCFGWDAEAARAELAADLVEARLERDELEDLIPPVHFGVGAIAGAERNGEHAAVLGTEAVAAR